MSRYIFMSILLLLSAGCALSPQQVRIKPELNTAVVSVGAQQPINVQVRDHRSTTVIGSRGGVYGDTSTIEIGNDWATETAYALSGALVRWEFRPVVNGRDPQAADFTVSLDELSYTPDRAVAGKAAISAVVSLEVHRGNSTWRGKYSASGEMGYVTVPSESENSENINKVLNLALQKMFEDEGLVKFLQE